MIVSKAYEYFDKKDELYKRYLKDNFYDFHAKYNKNASDMDLLQFDIEDANKNIILSGETSIIGYFNISISTWYWGWSVPFPNKAENYLSRKLLTYAFDIDINNPSEDFIKNSLFKSELLTSKIYMENSELEIEKYLAISMYLTKSDYYWKLPVSSFNVTDNIDENIGYVYYLLRNVKINEITNNK